MSKAKSRKHIKGHYNTQIEITQSTNKVMFLTGPAANQLTKGIHRSRPLVSTNNLFKSICG